MATKIPWVKNIDGTQGDTWNPVVGCIKTGVGCKNCYAQDLHNKRHEAYKQGKLQMCPQYAKPFSEIQLLHNRLDIPLKTRKPTTYFVNSMSDLFHKDVPDSYICKVVSTIGISKHTFIILTKRIERALDWFKENPDYWQRKNGTCIDNLWLLASASTQREVDEACEYLLQIPAAVKGLSLEPMVESIDISEWLHPEDFTLAATETRWIHWVIAGAESGKNRRPCNTDWLRSIKDQCVAAGVPVFIKQAHDERRKIIHMPEIDGRVWAQLPERSAR